MRLRIGLLPLSLLLTGWLVSCQVSCQNSVPAPQGTAISTSAATTPTKERNQIDDLVRQIDAVKQPSREIDVITGTDSDSFLITYGTPSCRARACLRVGLSAEAEELDFYFNEQNLIYVRITLFKYPIKDGMISYDTSRWGKAGERSLYFGGGKLLSYTSSGEMSQKYPIEPDGKEEMRLAGYLLRHWDSDSPVDLENWIKNGRFDD